MTKRDQELLEDVTSTLDNLRVTKSAQSDGDVSPMSDADSGSKRLKIREAIPTRLFAATGRIFDPLLYLRVARPAQLPTAVPAPDFEPPSLDEILAVGREKARLLVEAPSHRVKPVHPRSQSKSEPPAPPGPKLPVSVYRYCQANQVRFITIPVKRTFRSITFGHSRTRSEVDPWTEYMDLNSFSHYRLCHALYLGLTSLTGEESRVVVIVPHRSKKESQTDFSKIESVLGGTVRRISLTHMEKELGFPTFVCPPFGHEFAPKLHAVPEESRLKFFTVIDSSLVVEASTDCVFDLGIVALRMRPSELLRLSGCQSWSVIENLVAHN